MRASFLHRYRYQLPLAGRGSYERQLQRMADTGDFAVLLTPASMENIISSALNDNDIPVISFEDLANYPMGKELRPHGPDGPCYIQYSSGSSSSPKGIIGTQKNRYGQLPRYGWPRCFRCGRR